MVLVRAGAQWVAPGWFGRGQAPSGWRLAFLPKAIRYLFNINDDDDDANARSYLTMQLELQNQNEYTILERT